MNLKTIKGVIKLANDRYLLGFVWLGVFWHGKRNPMSNYHVWYKKWKREMVKKSGGSYTYFLEREGKTNMMTGLVFGKFPSDGNPYLTKISPIKYIYNY